MIKIDDTDRKILEILQTNSNVTTKEIAQQLNLSVTPTYERIKKLENNGIIRKYVALINPEKVGQNIQAYCYVTLKMHSQEILKKFEQECTALSEVIECHYIAGQYDFMLKIVATDMKTYHAFMTKKLSAIENIGSWQSSFILSTVKSNAPIAIP